MPFWIGEREEGIFLGRGKKEEYDSDEMYAIADNLPFEKMFALRQGIREQAGLFTDRDLRRGIVEEIE